MSLRCDYFESDRCRSCVSIRSPYDEQLASKQAALAAAFSAWPALTWLPPVASATSGFRSKAKMAVGGSAASPTLGLVDLVGGTQDLAECLLYPPALQIAFEPIKRFISAARLPPYDLQTRRGELKFVLLTLAEHSGNLMLRFVLRSTDFLPAIRRALPDLIEHLPSLAVVSANVQPLPAAIVEGPIEIALSDQQHLRIVLNDLPFYLRPRGFFQTNGAVAAALYRQARRWAGALQPTSVSDLFCGVGGFALHCADLPAEVSGIEVSAEAIEGARRSARELGRDNLTFVVGDAAGLQLPERGAAELVIVNPPRRGIGTELCAQIERSDAGGLIYSSCNPRSLLDDLRRMPSFAPREAQLFDMFPHTDHCETLVLLTR